MRTLVLAFLVSVSMSAPALAQGDAAAGETIFKRCAGCHAVGEGAANKMGPELNAVVGRTAGSLPDFNYSAPMKDAGAAGLVWTSEELHAFLEAPKVKVPGNKMSFPGLKQPEDIDNVIAYLMTFSPDAVTP